MILSNFYKEIMARLEAKGVAIEYFDLWNDQLYREEGDEDTLPFNLPAVFIQMQPIVWQTLGNKKQAGDLSFILICASEQYHETANIEKPEEINKGLEHLILIDNVFAAIQGFRKDFEDGSGFSSITRTGTAYDHDASGSVIVAHAVPFKTRLTDVAAMVQLVKRTPALDGEPVIVKPGDED